MFQVGGIIGSKLRALRSESYKGFGEVKLGSQQSLAQGRPHQFPRGTWVEFSLTFRSRIKGWKVSIYGEAFLT